MIAEFGFTFEDSKTFLGNYFRKYCSTFHTHY